MLPRHPLAWLLWLAFAFTAALTTRNPLYLVVVLLALAVIYQAAGAHSATGAAWSAFIRVGIFFAIIGVSFDALTTHIGDTVLFALPAHWPIVGGPITLEAVVHGATGVIQLTCLLVAGATFSLMLDTAALLRYVPSAFYHAGLVLTIGLAFIPQTVAAFQDIRDAQRVRGHQFRAARDLLPLIGPLLTTGLERSIQLAESLEARGLGYSEGPARPEWQPQAGLLLGSLSLGAALFSLGYWGRQPWLLALGGTGAALLILTLRRLAPTVRRSRYRRLAWTAADIALGVASGAGMATLLAVQVAQPLALFYTPYPTLAWPPFNPWLASIYLLLLAPLAPGLGRKAGRS